MEWPFFSEVEKGLAKRPKKKSENAPAKVSEKKSVKQPEIELPVLFDKTAKSFKNQVDIPIPLKTTPFYNCLYYLFVFFWEREKQGTTIHLNEQLIYSILSRICETFGISLNGKELEPIDKSQVTNSNAIFTIPFFLSAVRNYSEWWKKDKPFADDYNFFRKEYFDYYSATNYSVNQVFVYDSISSIINLSVRNYRTLASFVVKSSLKKEKGNPFLEYQAVLGRETGKAMINLDVITAREYFIGNIGSKQLTDLFSNLTHEVVHVEDRSLKDFTKTNIDPALSYIVAKRNEELDLIYHLMDGSELYINKFYSLYHPALKRGYIAGSNLGNFKIQQLLVNKLRPYGRVDKIDVIEETAKEMTIDIAILLNIEFNVCESGVKTKVYDRSIFYEVQRYFTNLFKARYYDRFLTSLDKRKKLKRMVKYLREKNFPDSIVVTTMTDKEFKIVFGHNKPVENIIYPFRELIFLIRNRIIKYDKQKRIYYTEILWRIRKLVEFGFLDQKFQDLFMEEFSNVKELIKPKEKKGSLNNKDEGYLTLIERFRENRLFLEKKFPLGAEFHIIQIVIDPLENYCLQTNGTHLLRGSVNRVFKKEYTSTKIDKAFNRLIDYIIDKHN